MDLTDTLVSGAIGLATGAFASRLLVDPRVDLLRVQGEIAEALLLYAWLETNVPPGASVTMTEEMRSGRSSAGRPSHGCARWLRASSVRARRCRAIARGPSGGLLRR